jgi:hypothetical protein
LPPGPALPPEPPVAEPVEPLDPVAEPLDPAVPDPPEPEVALVPPEPVGIVELLSSPPQCVTVIAANAIDGTIHQRMFMSPPARKSTKNFDRSSYENKT